MRRRMAKPWSGLLIGSFVVLVIAAPFLAERTSRLYGFVALMLVAAGILPLIGRFVRPSWLTVIVIGVVLRAGVFWMGPGLSDDAYRYAWDGIVQAEGDNPYLVRPEDDQVRRDRRPQLYGRLNSQEYFTVYPPLSQITFVTAATISGKRWPQTYYAIKLIIILVELLALAALWRTAEPSVAILYAWNPVVIVEIAGQAHTEG
ncbi:MAG: hypothetical protein R3282_08555, partial [Rhodothermales bacterium]|nr:hypothetical protein [Rhodothermales bacterium]